MLHPRLCRNPSLSSKDVHQLKKKMEMYIACTGPKNPNVHVWKECKTPSIRIYAVQLACIADGRTHVG